MDESSLEVASPCVRGCSLDNDDVCRGCNRTIAEIVSWGTSTNEEKRAILIQCGLREATNLSSNNKKL